MAGSSRAEWTNTILTGVGIIILAFGGYGHFSGVLADKEARILILEKEQVELRKDRESMDDELDVLWVGSTKNTDGVERNRKDIEKSNKYFEKFSEAVDRLIVSVTRLEEKIKRDKELEEKR